ncbi:MAG TPA: hypothetical protein VK631_17785 [Solirubrobacteraceae bacterium]|nr:hypothetical protein [Solirubrobacteraceae bacterium]
MTARRAIFIAPFDALSEPGLVAEVGTPGNVVVTNPAGTDPAP